MKNESALRKTRIRLSKSLTEVSNCIGTDVGNLSRIERGQPPTIELARKIQRYYASHGVSLSLDDIFGPDPAKSNQHEHAA